MTDSLIARYIRYMQLTPHRFIVLFKDEEIGEIVQVNVKGKRNWQMDVESATPAKTRDSAATAYIVSQNLFV